MIVFVCSAEKNQKKGNRMDVILDLGLWQMHGPLIGENGIEEKCKYQVNMKLERRPWKSKSKTQCQNCKVTSYKIVYPIENMNYKWESRCNLCNHWTVRHSEEDPRYYMYEDVDYV